MRTTDCQLPGDAAPLVCYQQQTVLVTGASGFTGTHCTAALQASGAVVVPMSQHSHTCPPSTQSYRGDLCDPVLIARMLRQVQPGYVLHLASLTPAREGASLATMMRTNALGTAILLDGVRTECPHATTVLVSSGAVYGDTPGVALVETCALAPHSAYGASKAAQEMAALAMGTQHGMRIMRARPFNLVGPGEPPGLLCSALARQIAAAECGLAPPRIQVGRLDTQRDFLDIRDAVAAYLLLGAHGCPGEAYNVCSGQAVQIGEILERLLAMAQVPLEVTRHTLTVGSPVQVQWGNADKLQRATGWQPQIPLAQSLADLLTWWRQQLAKQGQT